MNYTVKELESIARKIRYDIVKMIGPGKTGHLGGSCSIADVVTVLYFHKMKHDPKNPNMPNRDRFLLSKGHSALVQYAALAESGYFPVEELLSLKKMGSRLQGHPDMIKLPGIEANTGSLGQGLSISAGIAAAGKIDKASYRVYCVVGDGEIAEGQIWEAAMAAAFYKLDNLVAILDKNCLQATGCIAERFNTNPLNEKWESFGWHVIECDGHNIRQIIDGLDKADKVVGKPVIIIANTIKGCGISFAENVVAFHNGAMTQEQYDRALQELGGK
ncbi:MAG TPA: transketolase [Nitrospirota bacterium]|nr:transketolase [Nitrospirota bacterium]